MTVSRGPLVFLGPSLPETAARSVLPCATYVPPARRGDLDAVDEQRFSEVILIDGVMVYDHPPSPTEVYRLVQRGVSVLGAASIGALRAVELAGLGVRGIGWVYEQFQAGRVTADDELVARLDPRNGQASTLFLINLRYAAEHMLHAGELCTDQADRLVTSLAALHFEQRTAAQVRTFADEAGIPPSIVEQMLGPKFDIKARDAAAALAKMGKTVRSATAGSMGAGR